MITNFKLFRELLVINTFTFGGGYTIIPIIKQRFVNDLNLIEERDMDDIISLAQSVPGAMAIATSFLLGYKIRGIKGSIITTTASILPCIVIISSIFGVYNLMIHNDIVKNVMKGIGVGVSSILLVTVYDMIIKVFKNKRKYIYLIFIIISAISSYYLKINIAYILIVAGIIGLVINHDVY